MLIDLKINNLRGNREIGEDTLWIRLAKSHENPAHFPALIFCMPTEGMPFSINVSAAIDESFNVKQMTSQE